MTTKTLYTSHSEHLPVNKKDYNKIVDHFFENLSVAIIRDKYHWKVPGRIGTIRIKKVNPKKKSIDFNKTRELKKQGKDILIYHKNFHSYSNVFRFHLAKAKFLSYDKRCISFQPVSGWNGPKLGNQKYGKRGLAHWIMECSSNPNLKYYDCER